jgi:hypothetical protein
MLPRDELFAQIRVETDSVKAIAAGIRKNLEQAYRPQVPAVNDAMQPGATVGGQIVGGQWASLQNVYSDCIEKTLDAVFNIDNGSQALAQAADLIAARYGDADTFARASASAVDATLVTPPLSPSAPAGAAAGRGRVVAQ